METRQCPTLADDERPLIAHRIPTGECLSRQEAYYHKCARCTHRCATLGPEPEPVEILTVRRGRPEREEQPAPERNGHIELVRDRNGQANGTNGHNGHHRNGHDSRTKVAAAERELGAY